MRYLFIAFLFVSLFGHSQGIDPSSFQGNPNKGGFLKGVTLNVDDFGDTTYLYTHVDSTALADSIYLRGDSLILLKNGSGSVYRARIWDDFDYSSRYDIPNPQLNDIYTDGQKTYYWNGGSWEYLDMDADNTNEGNLSISDEGTNMVGLRSSTNAFDVKKFVGLNGIEISTNELDTINIGIDTTLFAGETQYLNPYVVTGDTTGFYLTVAQDTVLFVNTIDTAAYCCPPSFSGDTLYIGDNYVELPKENIIGGWGITATESPAYTWNLIADSSQVATQYDLGLKYTLPSLTNGSVLFSNGTTIAQDNANLFWDDTNNELILRSIQIGSNADAQLYAGIDAGSGATSASSSNFFGNNAGKSATNASSSNFFGNNAGNGATNAGSSNFFGNGAGNGATGSGSCNFFGLNAGSGATSASYSNFFGNNAGSGATSASYSNFFGFKSGNSFSGNNLGTNNIIIGTNISLPNATTNSLNIGGVLFGTGMQSSAIFNPRIVPTSGGRIGIMTVTPQRTLHITGEVRITDLTTDTPTKIVGSDGDGDLADIKLGNGVILNNDTLKVDSSKFVTAYDLTQISGSSKAIDRLASDFATTATSLQTTNIDYTFPSTGLYHVVLLANFQTTNTNGGIKAAYAASGGLAYDFISGYLRAPIDIYDATTERVSSFETITSGINTTGVNPSGTPHHLQSDMLINVTTAGTVTLTFASESGSYTATLKAGSTLIIEKLN